MFTQGTILGSARFSIQMGGPKHLAHNNTCWPCIPSTTPTRSMLGCTFALPRRVCFMEDVGQCTHTGISLGHEDSMSFGATLWPRSHTRCLIMNLFRPKWHMCTPSCPSSSGTLCNVKCCTFGQWDPGGMQSLSWWCLAFATMYTFIAFDNFVTASGIPSSCSISCLARLSRFHNLLDVDFEHFIFFFVVVSLIWNLVCVPFPNVHGLMVVDIDVIAFHVHGFVDVVFGVVFTLVYDALYKPRHCVLILETRLGFEIHFFLSDGCRPCQLFGISFFTLWFVNCMIVFIRALSFSCLYFYDSFIAVLAREVQARARTTHGSCAHRMGLAIVQNSVFCVASLHKIFIFAIFKMA